MKGDGGGGECCGCGGQLQFGKMKIKPFARTLCLLSVFGMFFLFVKSLTHILEIMYIYLYITKAMLGVVVSS